MTDVNPVGLNFNWFLTGRATTSPAARKLPSASATFLFVYEVSLARSAAEKLAPGFAANTFINSARAVVPKTARYRSCTADGRLKSGGSDLPLGVNPGISLSCRGQLV